LWEVKFLGTRPCGRIEAVRGRNVKNKVRRRNREGENEKEKMRKRK